MSQKIATTLSATSLILFNILDTIFTVKYIKYGPLDEANPIMAFLLQGDGCLFAFLKIFITTILTILLWLNQKHKIARLCLHVLAGFYFTLVMLWFLVIFLI